MISTSRVSSSSMKDVSAIAWAGMVSSLVAPAMGPTGVIPAGLPAGDSGLSSRLQIAVHEVDLLQAPEPLADVLGPDLPHALDRLQLRIGGGLQLLQAAELL